VDGAGLRSCPVAAIGTIIGTFGFCYHAARLNTLWYSDYTFSIKLDCLTPGERGADKYET
jgi:hypothetical protein